MNIEYKTHDEQGCSFIEPDTLSAVNMRARIFDNAMSAINRMCCIEHTRIDTICHLAENVCMLLKMEKSHHISVQRELQVIRDSVLKTQLLYRIVVTKKHIIALCNYFVARVCNNDHIDLTNVEIICCSNDTPTLIDVFILAIQFGKLTKCD